MTNSSLLFLLLLFSLSSQHASFDRLDPHSYITQRFPLGSTQSSSTRRSFIIIITQDPEHDITSSFPLSLLHQHARFFSAHSPNLFVHCVVLRAGCWFWGVCAAPLTTCLCDGMHDRMRLERHDTRRGGRSGGGGQGRAGQGRAGQGGAGRGRAGQGGAGRGRTGQMRETRPIASALRAAPARSLTTFTRRSKPSQATTTHSPRRSLQRLIWARVCYCM